MGRFGFIIVLGVACLPMSVNAEDAVPPHLQRFEKLVEQCQRFSGMTTAIGWRVVWEETFEPSDKPGWQQVEGAGVTSELAKVEDRSVVRLASTQRGGYIQLNEPISGEFAIEMVGRLVSATLCDLSLVTTIDTTGPGFQFGGYNNSRNRLAHNAAGLSNNRYQWLEMGNEPRIERDRWYTVRLEVSDGETRAYVDGVKIGSAKLAEDYDLDRVFKPLVYTWASTMEVDWVAYQKPVDAPPFERQRAWQVVFGEAAQEQAIQAELAQLATFLDSDDYITREAAHRLLLRAGQFAEPTLRKVSDTGSPEQVWRVRAIARTLRLLNEDGKFIDPADKPQPIIEDETLPHETGFIE